MRLSSIIRIFAHNIFVHNINGYLAKAIACSLIMLVAACGNNQTKTLASLSTYSKKQKIESTNTNKKPIEKITHKEVREEYRELLEIFEEDKLKEKIERRIADVYMMEGSYEKNVKNNVSSNDNKDYYSEATQAYLDILRKYPNSPDNAEVLYQLSKAYDVEGETDKALNTLSRLTQQYPSFPNLSEAWFRKGDIHYNKKQYSQAESAYQQVINSRNEKLLLNAHYMIGWSHYKQLKYSQSVKSFAYVLNQLLGETADLESLPKKDKPLVQDSITSTGLALDKLGGANQINRFADIANRPYTWMLYDNLGDYYLTKELFEKSATSFRLFVTSFDDSEKAPDLHVKLINTYIKGGFANQALGEKESFVSAYGINSNYTARRQGIRPTVQASLQQYIDELASHYHSKGQLYEKQLAKLDKNKAPVENKQEKRKEFFTTYIKSYNKAAEFYSEYVQTFPNDARVDEIIFLRAETLYSAYNYAEAIKNYEAVAYRPVGASAQEKANDAGYAAIISYQKEIDALTTGQRYPEPSFMPKSKRKPLAESDPIIKEWQQKAVDSMLLFSERYHTDKRSPSVLTNAAEYLFSLNQYERAIQVSSNLITNNKQLDAVLKKTAYGIIAHSYFELKDYQNAENNYLNQRQLTAKNTKEYTRISELLAASIYKKSEIMISQGEEIAAIDQLLKIKQLTPDSPIRITAQYDATILLIEAKRWPEAIVELLELQQRYPEHKLAVEFPRKLALAYEQNQQWSLAAKSYLSLSEHDPDADIRQEALFLTASLFKKSQNHNAAIKYFSAYIDRYPQASANYFEAHYHQVLSYEAINDIDQRNRWLDKTISANRDAKSARSDRSRWLAAWANAKYGDYYASQFDTIRLSLPIIKSIPSKNASLEKASARFQAAADYGIFKFVTMSSYKIGLLYRKFAKELREAPVPKELSASDRQVYAQIIDEQASPFDQTAIELHQSNIERAWSGQFNPWINQSFTEMRLLLPERFNKNEFIVSYGDGLR